MSPITRDEGKAWQARWDALRRRELDELRTMTSAEKFRRTAALFESAVAFGPNESRASEEQEVRDLWIRLRKAMREQE